MIFFQDLHELAAAEKQSALEKFEKAEKNIVYNKYKKDTQNITNADKTAANSATPVRGASSSMMNPQKGANESSNTSGVSTKGPLPSFWIPMLTPQAESSKVEKPDKTIYCPMSGKQYFKCNEKNKFFAFGLSPPIFITINELQV